MIGPANVQLDSPMIAEFCPRHRVRRLSLLDVMGMEQELEERLYRKVNLRTRDRRRYFRDQIVAHAEFLYAA